MPFSYEVQLYCDDFTDQVANVKAQDIRGPLDELLKKSLEFTRTNYTYQKDNLSWFTPERIGQTYGEIMLLNMAINAPSIWQREFAAIKFLKEMEKQIETDMDKMNRFTLTKLPSPIRFSTTLSRLGWAINTLEQQEALKIL